MGVNRSAPARMVKIVEPGRIDCAGLRQNPVGESGPFIGGMLAPPGEMGIVGKLTDASTEG